MYKLYLLFLYIIFAIIVDYIYKNIYLSKNIWKKLRLLQLSLKVTLSKLLLSLTNYTAITN